MITDTNHLKRHISIKEWLNHEISSEHLKYMIFLSVNPEYPNRIKMFLK